MAPRTLHERKARRNSPQKAFHPRTWSQRSWSIKHCRASNRAEQNIRYFEESDEEINEESVEEDVEESGEESEEEEETIEDSETAVEEPATTMSPKVPVKFLIVARSDGQEVLPDGTRNRPSANMIRDEVREKAKNDEYYVHIRKGDVRYTKMLAEIGGWMANNLERLGLFPDREQHIEYRMLDLPENYAYYAHVTRAGTVEYNFYGHPGGPKKKYRQAAEIAHHIFWLITDDEADEDNCKCVKCSPQGGIPKEKETSTNVTPPDQGSLPPQPQPNSQGPGPNSAAAMPPPSHAGNTGTRAPPAPQQSRNMQFSESGNTEQSGPQPVRSSTAQMAPPQQPLGLERPRSTSTQQSQQANIARPGSSNTQHLRDHEAGSSHSTNNTKVKSNTSLSSQANPSDSANSITSRQLHPTYEILDIGLDFLDVDPPHVSSSAHPPDELARYFQQQQHLETTGPHIPSINPSLVMDPNGPARFRGPIRDSRIRTDYYLDKMQDEIRWTSTQALNRGGPMDVDHQSSQSHGAVFNPSIESPPQNLQQIFDTKMIFYYRPGELVWVDAYLDKKYRLGVITGRATRSHQSHHRDHTYKIAYLGSANPLDRQEDGNVTTDHEKGYILPFLAKALPEIQDLKLKEALARGRVPDDEFKLFQYEPDACAILAAQRADRSFLLDTKLNINDTYPFELRNFDLYSGLVLGAERIWPGDAVRIRNLEKPDDVNSNHILIVSHIKETWDSPLRDHSVQANPLESPTDRDLNDPPASSTLTVVGNIYTLEQHPQVDFPLVATETLPEPLQAELNEYNNNFTYPGHAGYQRVLSSRHASVPINSILGRWYPHTVFHSLYPTELNKQVFVTFERFPPLASECLVPRGKHILPGQEGAHGLGRRSDGHDLLDSYRCALKFATMLGEYEGNLSDPAHTGLPLGDSGQPMYDFGNNPFYWTGPDGTDRND